MQLESNIQGLEKQVRSIQPASNLNIIIHNPDVPGDCGIQVNYESAAKREVWRRRVLALRDECMHLRTSVDRYTQRMFTQRKEQEEREALLARPVGVGGCTCERLLAL